MELIRASDTRSVSQILERQIEGVELDRGSVTSRLTTECVSIFGKLVRKLSKEGELNQQMFRRLAAAAR